MAVTNPKRNEKEDTLSVLSFNLESRPRKVEQAVKLELDEAVNYNDNPEEAHEQRVKIIRNSALSIGRKKVLRKKYIENVERKKSLQHRRGGNRGKQFLVKVKRSAAVASEYFVIWGSSLKELEGKFGSAVTSYFVFLKLLFLLNVFVCALLISFVVIPEWIARGSSTTELAIEPTDNDTCSDLYLESIDRGCKENGSFTDCVQDFLAGEGWIEETLLFYGSFSDSSNSRLVGRYNRPMAYIITTCVYLVGCMIVLVHIATRLFEKTLVYGGAQNPLNFSTSVLTGWDYTIHQEKVANYRKQSLLFNFQVDLEAERMDIVRKDRHWCQTLAIKGVRVVIHLLVSLCNLSAFYLIYFTGQLQIRSEFGNEDVQSIVDLGLEWLPQIVVTLLNNFLPNIFSNIVQYEVYSPSFEVSMTLIRISFLKLFSLIVLLLAQYNNITCSEGNRDECNACAVSTTYTISCWETSVGQEFYKLTIVDTLSTLLTVLFWEYPRKFISKKIKRLAKLGYIEFELSKNVLSLVFSQAISWLGAFFCPFLPLLTVAKYFIVFYLRKWSLIHNMVPSSREVRASQSKLFFMLMLLVTYLLCIVPVVYAITIFVPSKGCGPFQDLNTTWEQVNRVFTSEDNFVNDVYSFIGSSPFVIAVIVVLILLLFYQYSQAKTSSELLELLKDQLALEQKTKHALSRKIREERRKRRKEARQTD